MVSQTPPLSNLSKIAPPPHRTVTLDSIDRQLLMLLARDARVSQRGLARELRMSPPAIGDRIARLEREGVIRGYSAVIDWTVLGYVTCYLAVTATADADQGAVMSALHELPEVEDIAVITGSLDMLVRLRVRDHVHLRQFLLEHVWQLAGVQRTETFLSLAELPSKHLALTLFDDEIEESAR
ncbi:MAG TPA: Lrp/AsnC family transcriptional regulator [Jatrophihabitans sp.]|nr:Lrp/AsnC family transcriptional regulator [Jatrophihabitans sp.]